MKVTILQPKGYCAGVSRAIQLALRAKIDHPNKPVNVLGMLVHNQEVIDMLSSHGVNTLIGDNKEEIIKSLPEDSILVFTAHGHEKKLDEIANKNNLIIYDAVCPIVKNNLTFINDKIKEGHQIIYIGEKNHPEALGALSLGSNVLFYDYHSNFDFSLVKDPKPFVINQTTLNILEIADIHKTIKDNIPGAEIQNEICNATRLRQESILSLEDDVDAILVVGDKKSANANRLYELAKNKYPNISIQFVSNSKDVDYESLKNKKHVAISSGASTPSETIDVIYNQLIEIK